MLNLNFYCICKRVYLAEIFEDDGDIHVDDDKEADDKIGDEIGDGQTSGAAVAVRHGLADVRFVTVWRANAKPGQHAVPAGRCRHLEQYDHALAERLEVEHLVYAGRVLDVLEELHAEHGVDEHDEEQQETDVEQCWQRHGQRKQQRPDALGRLDESQNASNSEHPNNPEKYRAKWHVISVVLSEPHQNLHC